MKQYTYMMLKPDAFQDQQQEKILKMIKDHGLSIEASQTVEVTMDVMKILLEHYHQVIDEKGPDFHFPARLFNTFYFHGPHYIMPMKVSYEGDEDIIAYSRKLVGKTNPVDAKEGTIRATFSQDSYELADSENRLVNNVIHASDSIESAQRELQIWHDYL
ncbi:nucleoside-diphosphate kinase [Candidatus Stoquefichus massiliensis]|uniref:nucleoside-diphosphate kinase n=1 Tax=Candidatus Stoquefichus massiliensis TaxID=1470350 RepID=UPI00048457C5|nr:nucleoside-diphosphate kinase [Candidatus Stoquefichus massiliensis]